MYIVPTTSSPNQTFSSTIPIDGNKIKLYFFLRYNTEQQCWQMDLSDANKQPLLASIPLVGGVNILEQYSYLNIGSAYVLKINPNLQSSRPSSDNLGKDFILVWGDTNE